ncbi:gamma-aminobutyrate transaminase POP2 [Cucumis melo var. makuwa]|uniref:Gamma-aminobutyrate transaminase POP2 n=1 Tax=Cucumis melo var. makuwa TaxID=1194695 RepID=A0A5D3CY88_CUCMM|nr:gamma-aminobutyrate transaminase POP2 [Cucumis melo var. makuwa]
MAAGKLLIPDAWGFPTHEGCIGNNLTDVDPTIVERPVVRHVTDDFINNVDGYLSHASTISFPRTNFFEMDAMFLEFANDIDNLAGGSSSVGDNLGRLLNYLRLKLLEDVRSLDS